jgi:hypothetical protein
VPPRPPKPNCLRSMAVGMAAAVPARRVAATVENFMVTVGEECVVVVES